jgi:hypothetical protein
VALTPGQCPRRRPRPTRRRRGSMALCRPAGAVRQQGRPRGGRDDGSGGTAASASDLRRRSVPARTVRSPCTYARWRHPAVRTRARARCGFHARYVRIACRALLCQRIHIHPLCVRRRRRVTLVSCRFRGIYRQIISLPLHSHDDAGRQSRVTNLSLLNTSVILANGRRLICRSSVASTS